MEVSPLDAELADHKASMALMAQISSAFPNNKGFVLSIVGADDELHVSCSLNCPHEMLDIGMQLQEMAEEAIGNHPDHEAGR